MKWGIWCTDSDGNGRGWMRDPDLSVVEFDTELAAREFIIKYTRPSNWGYDVRRRDHDAA